jgi:hypothetical protein
LLSKRSGYRHFFVIITIQEYNIPRNNTSKSSHSFISAYQFSFSGMQHIIRQFAKQQLLEDLDSSGLAIA